jgi:hypothetical protein
MSFFSNLLVDDFSFERPEGSRYTEAGEIKISLEFFSVVRSQGPENLEIGSFRENSSWPVADPTWGQG